jgi:hypothetical protein
MTVGIGMNGCGKLNGGAGRKGSEARTDMAGEAKGVRK